MLRPSFHIASVSPESLPPPLFPLLALPVSGDAWCVVIDNCQEYCLVREPGLGMQSKLKQGTAASAVRLEECEPGAFDIRDRFLRMLRMERKTLTTKGLWNDINHASLDTVTALHWLRVLIFYIPELDKYRTDLMNAFEAPAIVSRKISPNRKTVVQPLGTNGEREIEIHGMEKALRDFDQQMAITKEKVKSDQKICLYRGDGATHGTICKLQRSHCTLPDDYDAHRHRLSTPEIWHTRATMLNSIATNHYGPPTSQDPSSLSRSSSLVNFKIPSDTTSCDFYPTARSLKLFWTARILDCWRYVPRYRVWLVLMISLSVYFHASPDLLQHFKGLANQLKLSTFEELFEHSRIISRRYTSQEAVFRVLNLPNVQQEAEMKIPSGSPWIPPTSSDSTDGIPSHTECADFKGDRVLGNEMLFLRDFGHWIEADYAVPLGDVGRLLEVLKVYFLVFIYSMTVIAFRYGSSPVLDQGTITTSPTYSTSTASCAMNLRLLSRQPS
jgi:hypothetical protein